jgi:hypothetical protein
MTDKRLTKAEWEQFFNVLFTCVGDEKGLHAVCVPLVKAMDKAGYMEEAKKYLEAAMAEEG